MSPTTASATADEAARAFIAALEGEAQRLAVPFQGGHVVWRRFGAGPALVLLHGGHGRWLHWARNIRAWAKQHTVWVPDMPGYGESDVPPEPTLASLVAVTAGTLESLVRHDEPLALVGFSFGALVAATLAATLAATMAGRGGGGPAPHMQRNPAARRAPVTHLALLGPGGHGGARRPRGELRPWREAAARQDTAALAEVMRHNLLMHMLHEPSSLDALALHIHTDACRRTRFHSKSISLAGGLGRALDAYPGALLLAWGEHDVTADPQAVTPALIGGRQDCRARILPGAGHWVPYERADEINEWVLAGLNDEPSTTPR